MQKKTEFVTEFLSRTRMIATVHACKLHEKDNRL
jgi:hypothetical protein